VITLLSAKIGKFADASMLGAFAKRRSPFG
jgi:hypothetical protein